MGQGSNVIEINGRRYDAATGKPVAKSAEQVVKKLDGVSASKALHPKKKSRPASEVHKKNAKSKTLNRAATKKPKASKPQVNSDVRAQPASDVNKQKLTQKISEPRQQRASSVQKSTAINKFEKPKVESPAKPTGASALSTVAPRADIAPKAPTASDVKKQLIAAQMAAAETSQPTKKPNRVKSWFKARPKAVTIAATGASILLLVGYITYLNIPNMALRVAASRAGFEANMPGYRPNGFKFAGPISYSPGQITIQYSSNTDQRAYTITERETNWDSLSLLENFVKPETDLYSTFQERGLTVYIYDGSNAAWVNGGIWYTIAGDSLLNSEQLLKIASSL